MHRLRLKPQAFVFRIKSQVPVNPRLNPSSPRKRGPRFIDVDRLDSRFRGNDIII